MPGKLARETEIRYASVSMVTDYDCWHPDHENVDVQQVIKVLLGNAAKAKNMIKNLIENLKNILILRIQLIMFRCSYYYSTRKRHKL